MERAGGIDATPERRALEDRWLDLTRRVLPGLAAQRRWPVSSDHCFQRILLDNACDGRWYDRIDRRPAYAHAPAGLLRCAVTLAEGAIAGTVDLAGLNRRSLAWRGRTG